MLNIHSPYKWHQVKWERNMGKGSTGLRNLLLSQEDHMRLGPNDMSNAHTKTQI